MNRSKLWYAVVLMMGVGACSKAEGKSAPAPTAAPAPAPAMHPPAPTPAPTPTPTSASAPGNDQDPPASCDPKSPSYLAQCRTAFLRVRAWIDDAAFTGELAKSYDDPKQPPAKLLRGQAGTDADIERTCANLAADQCVSDDRRLDAYSPAQLESMAATTIGDCRALSNVFPSLWGYDHGE